MPLQYRIYCRPLLPQHLCLNRWLHYCRNLFLGQDICRIRKRKNNQRPEQNPEVPPCILLTNLSTPLSPASIPLSVAFCMQQKQHPSFAATTIGSHKFAHSPYKKHVCILLAPPVLSIKVCVWWQELTD